MNQGAATTKMIELIGKEACQVAMQAYTQYMFASQTSGIDTVLGELVKIQKGLNKLRKLRYLTDDSELSVYDLLLNNLGVYQKPSLLFALILKIHNMDKSGPKADYALGLLVFILKYFYNQRTDNTKVFWPLLTNFLIEQGIGIEIEDDHKKSKDRISFEVLKSRYQYYNQRFMEFLRCIQEETEPSTKKNHNFLVIFCLLVIIVQIQSKENLSGKQKADIFKKTLLSPATIRKYLNNKK